MKRIAAVFSLAVGAWGCASYTDETREIRSLYQGRDFKTALAKVAESGLTADRNRLLNRLERAMIFDRMGDAKKTRALLLEADKIADDLYTVSVSKTAASFVFNDSAMDYSGEDYEKVAIHTQLALSFIGSDELKSAAVEARKINNKLYEINKGYDDHKNRYGEDAFARYLSGLIYETQGDFDDAIIDYRKALKLYQGPYQNFYSGNVPDALVEALMRLYLLRGRKSSIDDLAKDFPKTHKKVTSESATDSSFGELIVIHEVGQIAHKIEKSFIFGFGKQVIRFSFPIISRKRMVGFGATGVSINDDFFRGDNVQDMDAIAYNTLEDRRGRMIAKSTARLLAKGQLTEQAYKNFGPLGGLAANIYSAVTETADTRSWTLLPMAYYITRVRLKPGTYQVKIKSGGRVDSVEKVVIQAKKIAIRRSVG